MKAFNAGRTQCAKVYSGMGTGDMEKDFRIENVIADIKGKIASSGISVADQYLALPYYEKMMAEFRKQDEIVIVGSGVYGLRLYEMLEAEEIAGRVRVFCDNSRERQELKIRGVDVLAVEEAVSQYPYAHYVITPRRYENELLRQLVHLGIQVDSIAIYVFMETGLVD